MSLGTVKSIVEVFGVNMSNIGEMCGANGSQLGFGHIIRALGGYSSYDGYRIDTSEHSYLILIDNGQSCCELWGYFTSEDDTNSFVGKILVDVALTDLALNNKAVEKSGYYDENGGIQFVDFKFSDGSVLQFAVYNAHNGYYGHPIIIAKDDEIMLSDTL